MNRNRPANGSESKRRRKGEYMTGGTSGRTPATVMAECATLFRPTLAAPPRVRASDRRGGLSIVSPPLFEALDTVD